jgi:hypothetical protein
LKVGPVLPAWASRKPPRYGHFACNGFTTLDLRPRLVARRCFRG